MSNLVEWLRQQLDQDERIVRDDAQARVWLASSSLVVEFSPARVLREVQAKRRILDRYNDCLVRLDDPDYSTPNAAEQLREYEDFVLPALALPYVDRPGYDESWRP
jgi:hypothetical protein